MSYSKLALAMSLSHLLADTYTLYLKTQNYHWNVRGEQFRELHLLFETQYKELADAVDSIAERIRTLGYTAPGSYRSFGKLASIKEAPDVPPVAADMIAQLASDHEILAQRAAQTREEAKKTGDELTADLTIKRGAVHEKFAWMLRSNIEVRNDPNIKVA